MNVLIFGATGMVGQSVLRECLAAADVSHITAIGRTPVAVHHAKLIDFQHADMWNYDGIDAALMPFDACFFCLGVSSAGMSEAQYTHLTYDMTIAAATKLAQLNPQMTFIYVSGAGTDSSEQGRSMWARVKGKTENALLALPFKAAYMFRPGGIMPMHGIQSKTRAYRLLYSLTKPLLPLLHRLFPDQLTTSEKLGLAMLDVARHGALRRILESADINKIGTNR
ncbi:NAD(P)H-binding protein [Undibacterium sp. TJN19]|uniref:NAD(P)H-binding protein n=1 Tax=Undibacterium sp. TJN19 TaxID=3413055 RepID=UPI003BF4058E